MAKSCDYCNLPIRANTSECTVSKDGNDFHEKCWEWMQRQKRIVHREQQTGATFALIKGRCADEG